MKNFKHWHTTDGKKILVKDLSKKHFYCIIRDGYSNPELRKEAKKRGINVPKKRDISFQDLFIHKEAVHSCALEGIGNPENDPVLKAWKKNSVLALETLRLITNRTEFDLINKK